MGRVIGKHLHKALAVLLAAAMVMSLTPAAALAQTNPATDSQGNTSVYAGRTGENDGLTDEEQAQKRQEEIDAIAKEQTPYSWNALAGSASTTVKMLTFASFRCKEMFSMPGCISTKDMSGFEFKATFEGGTPISVTDNPAEVPNGKTHYYKATYTWTVDGVQSSDSLEVIFGVDETDRTPTIALPVERIYEKCQLVGGKAKEDIVVSIKLEGANSSTIPAAFPKVTFTTDIFTVNELIAPEGAEGADIDAKLQGSFHGNAELEYTDLLADSENASASQKSVLDALRALSNPNEIMAAAQLDVVNGGLDTDAPMYGNISQVELKLSPGVADKLTANTSGPNSGFTIAAVAGAEKALVYAYKSQDGNTYTFEYKGSDNKTYTATITKNDGYATLSFPTYDLTSKPGAFAISCPAAEKFTVNASVKNGTMTNTGTTQFAKGAAVEFVLSPFEGYVVDSNSMAANGESGVYATTGVQWEVVGNVLRLTKTDFANGANITVQVAFKKYEAPAADTSFSLDVSGINSVGTDWANLTNGWVQVAATKKDGSQVVKDAAADRINLTELKPGTPVEFVFHANDGYRLKNAWAVPATTAASDIASVEPLKLTGNEYVISTLEANMRVVAVFEEGNPPATDSVTYSVNGLVVGDQSAGSVESLTNIVKGTNPKIAITAVSDKLIDEIRLYEGLIGAADLEANPAPAYTLFTGARDLSSYDFRVANIDGNYTVAATFKAAPMQITVKQSEGGTLSVESGAAPAGGDRYSVVGADPVEFGVTASAGYTFTGVWVNGVKQTPAVTNGKFSLTFIEASTVVPEFTADDINTDVDLVSVVVTTDGNGQASPAGASFEKGGSLTLNFTVEGNWRAAAATVNDGSKSATKQLEGQPFSWTFNPADFAVDGLNTDATNYSIYVQFAEVETPDKPVTDVKYSNITLAVAGVGSFSPTGTKNDAGEFVYSMVSGTVQRLTAIPAAGYVLDCVKFAKAGEQLADVKATVSGVGGAPYMDGNTLVFTPAADTNYTLMVQFKKADTTEKRFTVTSEVDGGHGTVTPAGSSNLLAGSELRFTFIPEKGYKLGSVKLFTSESETFAGEGTEVVSLVSMPDSELPLTLNANTKIVAKFVADPEYNPTDPDNPANQKKFTVSPKQSAGGSIEPAADQTLLVTSSLNMSFSPYKGYELKSVTLKCDGKPDRTLNLSALTPNGTGSYSYTLALAAAEADSYNGKTVEISAEFARLVSAYTVSVFTQGPDETAAVTTSQSAAYGYVSPGFDTSGKVDVAAKGSMEFTFIEKSGYVVDSVYVGVLGADGKPTAEKRVAGNISSYTMKGVGSDKTLRVVYAANGNSSGTTEKTYTVTATPAKPAEGASNAAHGYLTPWGKNEVKEGGSIDFAAIADAGYKLGTITITQNNKTVTVYDSTKENTFGSINGNIYTLADVSANATVAATFVTDENANQPDDEPVTPDPGVQADRKISVSVVGTGAGTVTPGNIGKDAPKVVAVPYGGTQTFSFIPETEGVPEGFVNRIKSITIKRNAGLLENTITNVGAFYTFKDVKEDIELIVEFEQVDTRDSGYDPKPTYDKFTITAFEPVGAGTIEPSGATEVNAKANLAYTMKAAQGSHLSYITIDAVDGKGIDIPASELQNNQYVFTNISADHNIKAVFVKDNASGTPDDPADAFFTTFDISVDGARVQSSVSGAVSVKDGSPVDVMLSPTFGYEITAVRVVDAADPSRVLATFTPTGGSTDAPYKVTLSAIAGVTRATLLVDTTAKGGNPETNTFYNVTASVAADSNGNKLGTISPSGTRAVRAGSDVQFTLAPASGCTVDSVAVNGAQVSVQQRDGYYTFTIADVNGAMNVVAKFRQITDEEKDNGTFEEPAKLNVLTIQSQGAGKVQPVGVQKVKPGTPFELTLIPTGDAKLGNVLVDGADVTRNAKLGTLNGAAVYTYRIDSVNKDMVVSVTFVNSDGTIEAGSNDIPVDVDVKVDVKVSGNVYGGCVEPGDPFTVNPGDSQDFLIKPANGFYVAEVYKEESGVITPLTVRDWDPAVSFVKDGTAVTRAASGSNSLGNIERTVSIGSLFGVEKAWAADTPSGAMQKKYSCVTVDNIRNTFTLNVVLKKCSENGLPEYSYDDAASGAITVKPDVGGNGTVKPSDNMDTLGESGEKTYIIEPGVNEDGTLSGLESITINGVEIDLTGSDLKGPSGKQDPQKVVDFITNHVPPALKDGESIKWVSTPAPGHYELTIKAQPVVDEDGNPVVDKNGKPVYSFNTPEIKFEGEGKAYVHEVKLVVLLQDENGNPIGASNVRITATSEDNRKDKDGMLYMNDGGWFEYEVDLPDAEKFEYLGCELGGNFSSTPRTRETTGVVSLAAENPNRVYVYGPGTLTVKYKQKASTPVDPDGPNRPTDPDDPNGGATTGSVYTITASAGTGGSISNAGTRTYNVGRNATYTFSPESSAFVLDAVKIDGSVLPDWNAYSYTFTGCKAGERHTIEVTFKAASSSDDPKNPMTTVNRAVKTLKSLANTGDNGYVMVCGLIAVGCGALGVAIFASGRNRRRKED